MATRKRSEVVDFTKGRKDEGFFAWASDHAVQQMMQREMQERAARFGQ